MDTVPPSTPQSAGMQDAHLPLAKDMSHHINRITKNRFLNSLKEMYQYASIPGMVSMAGGIPSPAIFPFEKLSAEVLPYDHLPLDPPRVPSKAKKSLFQWLFESKVHFDIPKYTDSKDPLAIQLATSLQYQQATGPPAFPIWLRHYVKTVLKPGYADWDCLLDVGATDGFGKVFNMLLEMGDSVLVEEWSYPGAMNAYVPFEVNVVALKMDSQGVDPDYMDSVLANWDNDEKNKGKPFPRVFYTVPTGQNPTGATVMGERKQAIYDVCKKYDIVILEDEPYYCLFTGPWHPKDHKASPLVQRQIDAEKKEGKEGNEAFLKALPPTYLTLDTEGRVIRLDTFSKTSCPGSRLGWITTSPIFIERLTRASEASTQAPSGFATALTMTLLNTWGWDGYLRWLRGIKANYRMRRDWVVDALTDVFHVETELEGFNPRVLDIPGLGRSMTAYARPLPGSAESHWDEKRGVTSHKEIPLVSFIPPTAGMFVFLAIHVDQHPDFHSLGSEATDILMKKLWRQLAEHLVLFAPGTSFDSHGVHNIGGKGIGFFRISYSIITYEEVRSSIEIFAKVLKKFLHL